MTSRVHANIVQQEFTSQASIWSGSVPTHLQELASTLNLNASDTVLDVAAGSGRVSRAIAPWVKQVTALELTEAMLNQGKELAHKEGLTNITFILNPGHVLVIPNQHFENIYDLPISLAVKIHELARGVGLAMKLAYACDGIMLRQHNEPAGGQHIWHYHLHIIPRYQNDSFHTSLREPFPPDERAAYASRLKMSLKDLNLE